MKNVVKIMDVRIKLIVMLVYLLGMLFINQIRILGVSVVFLILLLLLLRISLKVILKRVLLVLPFFGMMLIVIPFQIPGDSFFTIQLGGISINPTYEGSVLAFTIGLKALISILGVLILTETSTVNHLLWGMSSLGIPFIMIQIIEFTLRYFIVIHQEFNRISVAQKSRGFTKGKNLFDVYTFKIIGDTIGHVFLRSLDRSEKIYRAMISRGYQGHKKFDHPFHPQKIEFIIAFIIIFFTGILVFIDKGGIRWL